MLKLFFSYSHRDEDLRNELGAHLTMLQRQGVIETWHDRRINAGDEFDDAISEHLEAANIVLLLVSVYFLASRYCYEIEMTRALERHEEGTTRVIPVILRPCEWLAAPFSKLQALPQDGKPVSSFADLHEAFHEVAKGIRQAASVMTVGEKKEAATTPPITITSTSTSTSTSAPIVRPALARSNNLRIKRSFTDQERDQFLEESFEFVAAFFENSLGELKKRQSSLDFRFRRVDANTFTAALYVEGEKRGSCKVRLGSAHMGDIVYNSDENAQDNSYNESLSIVDDGHTLALRPIGMAMFFNGSQREHLSKQGAAEYLWAILIQPLQ